MNPYTLEWWLRMRDWYLISRNNTAYAIRFTEPQTEERNLLLKKRLHYSNMAQWVDERIINKYGEK